MTSAESPPQTDTPVVQARLALAENRWSDAFALLAAADGEAPGGTLDRADLDGYGEAAWWLGRIGDAIEIRERAFAAHQAAGDRRSAAMAALALAADHSHRLESSVASGWVKRAERLLADEPEGREHAYLLRPLLNAELSRGAFDDALERAERVLDIGQRLGDPDLEALGLQDKGRVLVAAGRLEEGMALLEEAVVAALSGAVSAHPTAIVYCNATVACGDATDYRRAAEFADAAKRWVDRQSISGFPGMCRVRRVELIRMRGDWAEAEGEARRACAELEEFCLDYAGEGYYQIGEIRLRMGDLAAADEAFAKAHQFGRDPQPGLAMLRHAQGKTAAGAKMLARALGDPAVPPLPRARLLPAQVELALTLDDRATADTAATEMDQISEQYGTHVLRASAAISRGLVALAAGDPESAIGILRRGWRIWQETDAPYEAAQARVHLARAFIAADDLESAALELEAAEVTFLQLGAVPDVARVATFRAELAGGSADATTRASRTFMFTDIVRSTNLIDAVGDEAWGRLLAWHDTTIRRLLKAHAGEEVHHAGDGFFVAFASADQAAVCALEIQRKMAEQRREHGFAPAIRIGLHTDAALQTASGYEGRGVHVAARVGAKAAADQILVSRQTLEALTTPRPHGPFRRVQLRGIEQRYSVAELAPVRP
jgi:class 3 adenylate cyclase